MRKIKNFLTSDTGGSVAWLLLVIEFGAACGIFGWLVCATTH
jgi:hypothetical protein